MILSILAESNSNSTGGLVSLLIGGAISISLAVIGLLTKRLGTVTTKKTETTDSQPPSIAALAKLEKDVEELRSTNQQQDARIEDNTDRAEGHERRLGRYEERINDLYDRMATLERPTPRRRQS